MPLQQFDERVPVTKAISATAGTFPGPAVIVPGTDPVTRIDALLFATSETSDHVYQVELTIGSTAVFIGSILLPAGSGTTGGKSVDAIESALPTTVPGLLVGGGVALEVNSATDIASGKTLYVTGVGGLV